MSHTPTPEQSTIITAAKTTSNNLLIAALAGAAKTSTLVMLSEALCDTNILCLAFNKRIADEMNARLANNCRAMTLNSLGHRIWGDALGQRLQLDKDKTYNILKQLCDGLPKHEKEEAYELFGETKKAIDAGKTCGYVPTGHFPDARALMDDNDFFGWLDEEPTDLQQRLIRDVSLTSLKQALKGRIDFDDQILLPSLFSCPFPVFPLVMTDESQDFSSLNHAFLRKLVRKRIIAVGDECQSIYGFRGAHQDSMNLLRETFSMEQLVLSVSFRCPIAVVREAQWRAPHMKYPEWAIEGEVKTLNEWSVDNLPMSAAIICRNNAPLFSTAINLLKNRRNPQIIGNDIGAGLMKIMKKFGDNSLSREEAEAQLETWLAAKLRRTREKNKVLDQAACIRVFFEQGETLGDALAYAQHIFNSQGPILLMTGHKSKGLEFDHVFILDEHLIGREEQQEKNLRYVMQTRAKKTLTYIYSAQFVSDDMVVPKTGIAISKPEKPV
jgi:superfamily I DNA/RNA helicase